MSLRLLRRFIAVVVVVTFLVGIPTPRVEAATQVSVPAAVCIGDGVICLSPSSGEGEVPESHELECERLARELQLYEDGAVDPESSPKSREFARQMANMIRTRMANLGC